MAKRKESCTDACAAITSGSASCSEGDHSKLLFGRVFRLDSFKDGTTHIADAPSEPQPLGQFEKDLCPAVSDTCLDSHDMLENNGPTGVPTAGDCTWNCKAYLDSNNIENQRGEFESCAGVVNEMKLKTRMRFGRGYNQAGQPTVTFKRAGESCDGRAYAWGPSEYSSKTASQLYGCTYRKALWRHPDNTGSNYYSNRDERFTFGPSVWTNRDDTVNPTCDNAVDYEIVSPQNGYPCHTIPGGGARTDNRGLHRICPCNAPPTPTPAPTPSPTAAPTAPVPTPTPTILGRGGVRYCRDGYGVSPCAPRARHLTDNYLMARHGGDISALLGFVTPETRWEINTDGANMQVRWAILMRTGTSREGSDDMKQFFLATPVKEDNIQTERARLWCRLNMCEYRYEEDFGLGWGPTTNHIQLYWHPTEPTIRVAFHTVISHAHGKGVSMEELKKREKDMRSKKKTSK